MKFEIKRTIRYYYLRLIRLQGDPHSLAIGSALGVFIGISPTLPLHTILIICLSLLFRVSTLAAFVSATIICNPLTVVPIYYLCWKVGNFFFPDKLSWDRMHNVLAILTGSGFRESIEAISQLGLDTIIVMLTGGIIIGLPLAAASYFLSFNFFIKIHEKRRRRHILH